MTSRGLFFVSDFRHEHVQKVLLCALAASLFLKTGFSAAIIVMALIYWLVSRKYIQSFRLICASMIAKLFVLYFLMILLSAFFSDNKVETILSLEARLMLVIVPVVFIAFSMTTAIRQAVMDTFTVACVMAICYSTVSTIVVYEINVPKLFTDRQYLSYYSWILPQTIQLGSNYYSLFIAFGGVWLIHSAIKQPDTSNRILRLIMLIAYFCFLVLLGSRTALVAFFVSGAFLLVKARLKDEITPRVFYLFLAFCIMAVMLSLKSPYLYDRIRNITDSLFANDPRNMTFRCGLETIMESPVMGIGIGDVQQYALSCYEHHGYTEPLEHRYNFHNEFLEITASSGLVALTVFLLLLFLLVRKSVRQKNDIGLMFMFMLVSAAQTESLLSRNKGILFFTFFATLLVVLHADEKNTSR